MVLANGFECSVDENALDDWELFESICAVDKGDMTALPAIVEAFLGADQKAGLIAHIKAQKGKAGVSDIASAVAEIINNLKAAKK